MSKSRVARLGKGLRRVSYLFAAPIIIGAFLYPASVVKAETGGYPHWDAPECSQFGAFSWCVNGSPNSERGYGYRNCTDYAAWKVSSLGVGSGQYQQLYDAKDWNDNAPSKGLTVDTTPSAGSVAVRETGGAGFGHVAFVESVNGDGTITISDYNSGGNGNYGTATDTVSNFGFTSFVHFEEYMEPVVSDISPTTNRGTINDAAANSQGVWAAGWEQPSGSSKLPVVYQRSGSSWTTHLPAASGTIDHELKGIATDSSGGVWAVGNYIPGLQKRHTLAYHWDGSAWTKVTSDNPGGTTNAANYLDRVAVDGGGTPWAVGHYSNSTSAGGFLEKWNGTKFEQQTLTLPSGSDAINSLRDIDFSSATDGWMVGGASVNPGADTQPLFYHYDGSAWTGSYVLLSSGDAHLVGVSTVSPTNAWAVGYKKISATWVPLVMHYDGSSWAEVSVGSLPSTTNSTKLWDIKADNSNVWIIGQYVPDPLTFVAHPLIMRYNGHEWGQITVPSVPASKTTPLYGATIHSGDLWAGGYSSYSPSTNPIPFFAHGDLPY